MAAPPPPRLRRGLAVRENQLAIANFLLVHGAEALVLGDVLEMARDREYSEMTRLLERKLAHLHGASSEEETVAAEIRDRDSAQVLRLLDDSPQLVSAGDARSNQPIHWAMMTRQIPLIDELLARGADIDARRADDARPIQLTSGDYHYRGWRDPGAPGRSLYSAVYNGHYDIARLLLERGAYPNPEVEGSADADSRGIAHHTRRACRGFVERAGATGRRQERSNDHHVARARRCPMAHRPAGGIRALGRPSQ